MARPLYALIRRLRKAAGPPGDGAPTDGELLDRWVRTADEAAFELLLWRHGPMVLAACRRLLRDGHLAEDAFQATWLVLLRRAGSVRRPEALPAWLHRVACRVALRARAAAARRAVREGPPVETPAPAGFDEASWRDLRAVLDEEIDALPVLQRQAFVLCCLEGRTHVEAARELGCPQGTLSAWLARARARLRGRLARRGVTLGAGGLALGMAEGLAQADVPRVLVSSLVTAARGVAAAGAVPAGVLSGEAAAFAEEVLRAMRMTKFRIALATLVVGVGMATGLLAYQGQAQTPTTSTPQAGSGAAQPPAAVGGGTTAVPVPATGASGAGAVPPPAPGAGGAGGGAVRPPARASWPRWEYKALTRTEIETLGRKGEGGFRLTVGLNELGAQGWELVAIEPGAAGRGGDAAGASSSTYVFRRSAAGAMMRPGVPGAGGSAPVAPGGAVLPPAQAK
jgi:RNA polymerase sigma factor (sigma-70 family)